MSQNTEALDAAGLIYLAELAKEGPTSHRFANALVKSPFRRSLADIGVIQRHRPLFHLRPDREMLVSSESLANPKSLAGLKHVARFFKRLDLKPRSAMFVRNQVDQLSSHFAQRARSLRCTDDFTAHLTELHLQQANWNLQYQRHKTMGFEPRFGVFRGQAGRPIAEALFTLLGLRDRFAQNVDFGFREMNASVGEITVLAGVTLARHLAQSGVQLRSKTQGEIRGYFNEGSALIPEGKFVGPSLSDRERIRAYFATSNRALAKVLSPEDYDELVTERLPLDQEASPRTWEEMSPHQRDMFDTVIAHIQSRIRNSPGHSALFPPELLSQKLRPN